MISDSGPSSPASTDALLAEIARLKAELQRRSDVQSYNQTLNRAILESATDFAIISLDLQGRVTSWNEGAVRILGWSEGEALGRPGHMIFTEEEIAQGLPQREMQAALQSGRSLDERYHVRKDGSCFWAAGMMTPLRLDEGEPIGFMKILRDRTAAHEASEALKASEARLRLRQAMLEAIFRHAPVGLTVAEAPTGRSLMISDEVYRLLGRRPVNDDATLFEALEVFDHDGERLPVEALPIMRSLHCGEVVRRRPLVTTTERGERLRIEVSSTPLFDSEGEIVAAVAVLMEVEERERAVERQQLLISELAHRMKNTLAMVQAIVGQTLRTAGSLDVAREQIMDRFSALARAQDILTQTSWDSALLPLIVSSALKPLTDRSGQVEASGPEVRLGSRAALNFTLALHELATNATKYGALSTPHGRVEIDWRVEATAQGEQLVFTWNERGGPAVEPPRRKGFGSRLLDGLSRTFDASSELVYDPGGVCWRVQADLAVLQQV